MTAVAMNNFLDRVRNDRDMAARLYAAIGVKEGEDAIAVLLGFAVRNGFDVDANDADLLAERLTLKTHQDGELEDGDLNAVTGGGGYWPDSVPSGDSGLYGGLPK